jgi:uracil-DNA glycosylase
MKRELNIIVEELRRLKEEGVSVVTVSDDTLSQLRKRTAGLIRPAAPVERAAEASAGRRKVEGAAVAAPSRKAAPPPARKLPPPPQVVLPEGEKKVRWEALREQVLSCATCRGEGEPGRTVVFGVGSLDADIFFIGEAPGADEELAGAPFAGKAGETLSKMIGAMGLSSGDVYTTNILNWRPSMPAGVGHRAPTQEEIDFCLPYLLAQIEIVKPKVLVALGNTAISGLFGADPKRRLIDARGHWKDFQGIPTMLTYHPAYLVRNASIKVKRAVWEDLLQVMEKVGIAISEKQRGYFLPKG